MRLIFTLFFWGFFYTIAKTQVIYFNQNFDSATSSSQIPFENANTPTVGQFNYITNALITTGSEKYLKFIGNNAICRVGRSTEFSPTPSTLYVQFSVRASSIGADSPDAVEFYFGNGANFDNSTTPPSSAVMSIKFGVNVPSSLVIQGVSQSASPFITVTLFINNDSRPLTYNDSTRSGTVNAKKYDLYLGTTLISNDLSVDNPTGNLTKFKLLTKSIVGSPTLDFDNFIIKNDFITLANELTFFKADNYDKHKVSLNWETALEVNSAYFAVERSRDGINYIQISKVNAAGASSIKKAYQFIDETPSFGTNYYRLRLVGSDGKERISRSESIIISDDGVPLGVFPNPVVSSEFNVKVENIDEVELNLFDFNGRNIPLEKTNITQTIVRITPPQILDVGIYILKVQNSKSVKEYKVVVFK